MTLHLATPVCAAAVLLAISPAAAQDADPDMLSFALGAFDATNIGEDNGFATAEGRVELRLGGKLLGVGEVWRGFGPLIGVMANADGAVMGYAGIYADIRLGRNVVLQPSTSVAAYGKGSSKDLGGVLEFNSGVLLAYRFESQSQLGIEVTHISNASVYDDNPGVNSVLVQYAVPLGRLW